MVRDGAVLVAGQHLVRFPPHHHPDHDLWVYLGRMAGEDIISIVPRNDWQDGADGARMVGLRDFMVSQVGKSEQSSDLELAVTAVAVSMWHTHHGRCAVCGTPTAAVEAGWLRRCEACGKDHYPRTDPAVIVAITDHHDRMLLAHASYWSAGRYSHLAGYVEPGESFEAAVHREVGEESGLTVNGLTYWGSQSWPYPASVMVAFTAQAQSTELAIDGKEISDARFFTREELSAAVADGHVVVAPVGSIARGMLDEWWLAT